MFAHLLPSFVILTMSSSRILKLLDASCIRNPAHATQMSRYFKKVHPFYGIKSGQLRELIRDVQVKYRGQWTAATLLEVADGLLCQTYGEKKMLGVYLLGVPFNRRIIQEDPHIIETIGNYIDKYVNDWATCDALSSQVVRHIITAKPEYIPQVKQWSSSLNDWKQRSSCVSFLSFARLSEYKELILEIASRVVKNSNRFPQLGVGWMLRELSVAEEETVVEFIKENYCEFSREGLRYAIEKMDAGLRKELLEYGKGLK